MAKQQKSSVFRKKALESISSPEQLTDYLHVTTPGVWLVLAAVIVLLCGLFAWSAVGRLETLAGGIAVVEDGTAKIMVLDITKGTVRSGMTVRIGTEETQISITEKDEYGRTVAYAPVTSADGRYEIKVVTESVSPISFLFS